MRPSISVATAGLLCFGAYVSAQPNSGAANLIAQPDTACQIRFRLILLSCE
jgi:hypothetical protein